MTVDQQNMGNVDLSGHMITGGTHEMLDVPKELSNLPRRRSSLEALDPYSHPEYYYGPKTDLAKVPKTSKLAKTRTMSYKDIQSTQKTEAYHELRSHIKRRGSQDEAGLGLGATRGMRFFIQDIDATLKNLLESEDTDGNSQITIEDTGPKVLRVGTLNSNGYNQKNIRGTYMLSNLLQELTMAKRLGRNSTVLDEARLNENPVDRLSRSIKSLFWKNLTRRLDADSIAVFAKDTKIVSNPRIYVPFDCHDIFNYFQKASEAQPEINLEVEYLPEDITPEFVKSINTRPGLLALAMERVEDPVTHEVTLKGFPYVVPGGRFNDFYGWDSYMETLGLIVHDKVELARGMVEHFIFEINHYGKILNANRSYYLTRSQPPFLTDMTLKVFEAMGGVKSGEAKDLLLRATKAAIKEYKSVWMGSKRLHKETGLSVYRPDGVGIPPETEPSHFDSILTPYAEKHGISIPEFRDRYNDRLIEEPELDEYFENDRALRESGHDTSYRFENVCAHLATIDLNALLYKYEADIAFIIKTYFGDKFESYDGTIEISSTWVKASEDRKASINKYLWNKDKGMFFDYDVKLRKQASFESVTTVYALWAGLASKEQAERMTKSAKLFEELGGLVAGTERSRGPLSLDRPSRQWDYPFGWAPHQLLAWSGFAKYGYENVTRRLAYRWLFLMTKAFVDYNGIVVEKYNVTKATDPHRVDAEYGNQGADFKGVATEGFGWVNASYAVGLTYLQNRAKRALGTCTPPDVFFNSLRNSKDRELYGLDPISSNTFML